MADAANGHPGQLPKAPDAPLDLVEWRVQGSVDRAGGVNVIAYLDAPTVAELLDEWVGPNNWYDRYASIGAETTPTAMWCELSIRPPGADEWVTKVDLGVPSNMEAAKGLVSDAFKRVAMRKWGVGRNVCALPVLRLTDIDVWDRKDGKKGASLSGASYAQIRKLLRAKGFEQAAESVKPRDTAPPVDLEPEPASEDAVAEVQALLATRGDRIMRERLILQHYKVDSVEALTAAQARAIAGRLQALADGPVEANADLPVVGLTGQDYALLDEAGCADEHRRHALIWLATDGARTSSKQVTAGERDRVRKLARALAAKRARLEPDGPGGEPILLDAEDAPVLVATLLEAGDA